MSPALANDGALSFVVLLVVLLVVVVVLAMMLVAVIRLPEWDGSSSEDATRPLAVVSAQNVRAPQAPALPRRARRTARHRTRQASRFRPRHAGSGPRR